jgi:cephalosporin hydroxylase
MLKQSLRKAFYRFTPRVVVNGYLHLKLIQQARRLCALKNEAEEPRIWIDELMRSEFFRPFQVRTEILRLLEIIRAQRPSTICEIGAAWGGTTLMFADAATSDSTIVTVDLTWTYSRRIAIGGFAQGAQKIICLQGNSHLDKTHRAVCKALKGRKLDLLFIDGDHSYEGVTADFKLYSPLVRQGGMIVLHDIVPDYKTRYGTQTWSYTGGVPQFWDELKSSHQNVEEIVEDPMQDGLGIGILFWNESARAAAV